MRRLNGVVIDTLNCITLIITFTMKCINEKRAESHTQRKQIRTQCMTLTKVGLHLKPHPNLAVWLAIAFRFMVTAHIYCKINYWHNESIKSRFSPIFWYPIDDYIMHDTLECRTFKEFADRCKFNLKFLQFMNCVCEHKMQKYPHIHWRKERAKKVIRIHDTCHEISHIRSVVDGLKAQGEVTASWLNVCQVDLRFSDTHTHTHTHKEQSNGASSAK